MGVRRRGKMLKRIDGAWKPTGLGKDRSATRGLVTAIAQVAGPLYYLLTKEPWKGFETLEVVVASPKEL